MKIKIDFPAGIDGNITDLDDRGVMVHPTAIQRQHLLRVCGVRAIGENGNEARAVLSFNSKTGQFVINAIEDEPTPLDFDLPPDEFEQAREERRRKRRSS